MRPSHPIVGDYGLVDWVFSKSGNCPPTGLIESEVRFGKTDEGLVRSLCTQLLSASTSIPLDGAGFSSSIQVIFEGLERLNLVIGGHSGAIPTSAERPKQAHGGSQQIDLDLYSGDACIKRFDLRVNELKTRSQGHPYRD